MEARRLLEWMGPHREMPCWGRVKRLGFLSSVTGTRWRVLSSEVTLTAYAIFAFSRHRLLHSAHHGPANGV